MSNVVSHVKTVAFGQEEKMPRGRRPKVIEEIIDELVEEETTSPLGQEEKMPRGRRPKLSKRPTMLERGERLRQQIIGLPDDLLNEGFGDLLKPPGPIKPIVDPVADAKTDGMIGHVQESLGTY